MLQDEQLLALLYVDSQEPHFCDSHDLDRLAKFSRIIAKSVTETAAPRRGSPILGRRGTSALPGVRPTSWRPTTGG